MRPIAVVARTAALVALAALAVVVPTDRTAAVATPTIANPTWEVHVGFGVGQDANGTCIVPGTPMSAGSVVRLVASRDGTVFEAAVRAEPLDAPGLPDDACTLLARFPDVPVVPDYLIEIAPGDPAPADAVATVVLLGFWADRFEAAADGGCVPSGPAPRPGAPVRTDPPDPAVTELAIEGRLVGDRCYYGAVVVLPPAPRYAVVVGHPGEAAPVPATPAS